MFERLSQRFGKKKVKTEELPPREAGDLAVPAKNPRRASSNSPRLFGLQLGKRKQETRKLWEREFNIVQAGLDEKQVTSFVSNLISEQKASQETTAASFRSLIKTAVTDAEQIAANIKMKAQTEATAEGAMIISQAKQEAQEVKRRAEIAAQKEAEDILAVANRKTEITEIEAKQKALFFLLRAREEIEKEIRAEYKMAHSRLFSSLQDLISEGQNIEGELKGKRAQLWESKDFELKQYEATLLNTPGVAAPPPETTAPVEIEAEPDIASEEKTEEPTQLQEEPPQEIEQPIQLQEEALEEKVEEPIQLQEEAPQEMEQPVQLQEEPPQEIEQPIQLQEESAEEHLPEESPDRGEDESARLELDRQASYTGEVEVEIATPVDPKMVYQLYDHLQTIPELRILHTRGSWDRGTTIAVVLEKPIPLISVLSEIDGVEVTPELPQKDSLAEGISSSLLGGRRKGAKRIRLTLKEAQVLPEK